MNLASDLLRTIDPVQFALDCKISPDPWQAALLREKPRRGILCCSRQAGKSTVSGLIGLHTALFEPNALVVIVSPSERQSKELLRSMKGMLANLDSPPEYNGDSVLKLEFPNKSRILALPGSGDTIRGLSRASLVIVDEASRVDDEMLAAVRPMTAVSNGSILLLSTPNGRRGFYFEIFAGKNSADTSWTRVKIPASECKRLSPEFLAEELRALGPLMYQQEYGLEFIENETMIFPTHLVRATLHREGMAVY